MKNRTQRAAHAFTELLTILRRLRGPGGCPWDQKQTEKTMAPLILEEAFEVADAIEEGEAHRIAEELGDLSMNLLSVCLMAEDRGAFDAEEVFQKISQKLIYRHPHVFKEKGPIEVEGVLKRWEDLKRDERKAKNEDSSALAGIPLNMPALLRALRLTEKLKRTGLNLAFLKNDLSQLGQLSETLSSPPPDMDFASQEELAGKLLFNLAMICSENKINPEIALRSYLKSLERTYRYLESTLGEGLKNATPKEIAKLWKEGATGIQ